MILKRLPEKLGVRYYIFWPTLTSFLIISHILGYKNSQSDIFFVICLWIAASWICTEMVWAEKSLRRFKSHLKKMVGDDGIEVLKWYEIRHSKTFDNYRTLLTGFLFATLVLYLFRERGIQFHEYNYMNYLDVLIIFVTCLLGGMSQWTFHNIGVTVNNLGNKNIRPNLHDYRKSGIFYIGNVLSKIWFGGMGLVFLGEATIFLAPIPRSDAFYFHIIIILLCIGAVIWFFVVQIRIHNVMSKIKKEKIENISAKIDEITDNPVEEASKRDIDEIESLRLIHGHIKSLPEWPFDTNIVFRVLTAGLIPILSALLDIII